ncbi:MAG: ABC transporter ATP-binding protein, partial [Clostridia bacterium]|nr:ABC transporter ATP-binding protein [Clostridia bacterium]
MKTKINFWQTIKRVVGYAKPHRVYFYLACLFDLIAVASNMFMPVVLSWGIDKIVGVGQVDFPALQKILIVIVILTIISSIFEWFAVYFENILSNRTSESIRNLCFNKINNVPLKYIDNTAHGDIMNTMINDVDNVASGFLSGFRTILSGIAT